jgi:hypothetical protein
MTFSCIYFLIVFFSERKWKKLKETERGNCSHGNTRTRVVLSVHACDFCGKLCNRLTSARATQRLYLLLENNYQINIRAPGNQGIQR